VGVMAQAQNDAAIAATRSRINIIEKILEIELENYEVRRSPISFSNIGELIAMSGLSDKSQGLLHGKIFKRMIVADLIRAELPDGSITGGPPGQFPSQILTTYLFQELNIPRGQVISRLPEASTGWNNWNPPIADSNAEDTILEDGADRAEILYENLLNIDVDGTAAIDLLGSAAIGDTDDDGVLEVLDAWGEPLFLEWQQERLQVGDPEENIWTPVGSVCGLSCEHAEFGGPNGADLRHYCQPILPTQIRPRLVSERMFNIDGNPSDYAARRGNP
jgi:hypothetical protein